MSENPQPRLLVTGASGHLGRRVLELLLEANAGTVIASTRTPEKLADLAEQGVIIRHGDFDDANSLAQAFEGVDRLLLISTDVLGEPGKRLNQHQTAVNVAKEVGVKHVVYTSIVEATDTPVQFAPDHAGTEQALAESGISHTVLRNNLYMEVLVYGLSQAFKMGGLYSAAQDGKTAYICREDCARVAAVALASSFEGQRILNITGPEALSQEEIVTIASAITGKPLTYVPLSLEQIIEGMVGAGLPRPIAETYASIDSAIAQGKFASVTNAFKELTGEQPTRLADFLSGYKDALLQ